MFLLAQQVFGLSDRERKSYDCLLSNSEKYGVYKAGQLRSQLLATHFKVKSRKDSFQMAGIGSVATHPDFRGEGGVRQLFEKALPELARNGIQLSFLAPFSYEFYEKFGYRQIFSKQVISIQANQLKKSLVTLKCDFINFHQALPEMQTIYSKASELSDFSLARDEWWWHYSFNRQEYHHVIIRNQSEVVVGYLIYQLEQEDLLLKELMMIDYRGLADVFQQLFSQYSAVKKIVYRMPKGYIDFNYFLKEPAAKVELIPHMMGRILSFSSFVQSYTFEKVLETPCFFLQVVDEQIEENNGVWKLEVDSEGKNKVTSVSEYDPKLVLTATIGIWTQLFLGYSNAEQLIKYGKIRGDSAFISLLAQIIPLKQPRLFDFF